MSDDTEAWAARVVETVNLLRADGRVDESDCVHITYGHDPRLHGKCDPTTLDKWRASWRGHAGSGMTCEMALMELHRSLLQQVDLLIALAEEHARKATERAEAMRALKGR